MLATPVRHSGGQPNTQGPRKLRDSCTDCASSKVRCSKDKPICVRCARRGVTCIYMVSRRTGRTSSNVSKGNTSKIRAGTSGFGACTPAESARTLTSTARIPSRTGRSSMLNRTNEATGTNLPSLRVGATSPSQTTTATGRRTGQRTMGSMSGLSTHPDTDLWNSILSPAALMAHSTGLSPPIDIDISNLFDLGFDSPMVLDCPEQSGNGSSNSGAKHHTTVASPDLFDDIPLSVSDQDFSSVPAFDWVLPSTSSISSNGSRHSSFSSNPRTCCLAIALDILIRLFPNASSGCTLPNTEVPDAGTDAFPPQARSIDGVISENKHTIECLTSLLGCPCSQDEYLISIMTLIALKVMGWYAAAAADESIPAAPSLTTTQQNFQPSPPPLSPQQQQPQPQIPFLASWADTTSTPTPTSTSTSTPFTTSSTTSTSPTTTSLTTNPTPSTTPSSYNSASPLTEQVLRAPATVGNYCVAGQHQHQGRMAAQLVLSELHRVQRLVNALAERLESVRVRAAGFSGVGFGSGVGAARTPPFSVPTFCLLEEDLRKRLRVLSSETIDVLRRA